MPKNIAYIGSCLSASVVSALLTQDKELRLIAGLQHMRLDVLADILVERKPHGAPTQVIDEILTRHYASKLARASRRLLSQEERKLQSIEKWLPAVDLLVLDNNYDLSAALYEIEVDGVWYRFTNLPVTSGEAAKVTDRGLMPISEARDVYGRLFSRVAEINPGMRIVFLNYPVSGFEARGLGKSRVGRARTLAASPMPSNVHSFPLVRIDSADLSAKGGHYFSDRVYETYARAIGRMLDGHDVRLGDGSEIDFIDLAKAAGANVPGADPSAHPYEALPADRYWKSAVGERFPLAIQNLYKKKFEIRSDDAVATCGSCFAQHIGRRMKKYGFNYLDVEPAPNNIPEAQRLSHGYGIYSARYGNVYTPAQLLQLFQRAFGEIISEEHWESDGRFYDPFRPNLQPGGFASQFELSDSRRKHLAAVRKLFTELDVFVFTMGLTECWQNAETSSIYPLCPGVTVGRFDSVIHKFRNLTFGEVLADMKAFVDRLKSVNSDFRMILTVSPVPLTATAENRHVLVSTTHSKSVLRAAAGELAATYGFIDYFPSYEIVVGHPFRGMFFENNLRTVHDEGVDYVMSHFFGQHLPTHDIARSAPPAQEEDDDFCDEVFLEVNRSLVGDNQSAGRANN